MPVDAIFVESMGVVMPRQHVITIRMPCTELQIIVRSWTIVVCVEGAMLVVLITMYLHARVVISVGGTLKLACAAMCVIKR